MDDIFEEFEEVDDFNPARLPDLADELETSRNNDESEEGQLDNPEILSKLESIKGASKKISKKSIPKLNAERLIGDRGIPVLPLIFKKIPLLGKHHEVTDLKIIMQHLEHWGHRLFPKMPFSEVLDRVERLGSKKEVQNCVKRIRLDLPVSVDEENIAQEDQETGFDPFANTDETDLVDLLDEQQAGVAISRKQQEPVSSSDTTVTSNKLLDEPLPNEIKARIERNKLLALQRRAAKFEVMSK